MGDLSVGDSVSSAVDVHDGNPSEILIRFSSSGIWVNPDIPVDEAAQRVLAVLEPLIRQADEIVRLRERLERAEAERITAELQLEREQRTSESLLGMSQMYEKEYERARDILAALRDPSDALIDHAITAYRTAMTSADHAWYANDEFGSMAKVIRAVVAMADEQGAVAPRETRHAPAQPPHEWEFRYAVESASYTAARITQQETHDDDTMD